MVGVQDRSKRRVLLFVTTGWLLTFYACLSTVLLICTFHPDGGADHARQAENQHPGKLHRVCIWAQKTASAQLHPTGPPFTLLEVFFLGLILFISSFSQPFLRLLPIRAPPLSFR